MWNRTDKHYSIFRAVHTDTHTHTRHLWISYLINWITKCVSIKNTGISYRGKNNVNSMISGLPDAAPHSNQHRQMLRLFHPPSNIFFLRSFNQFPSPDFSIDPICIAWLKTENQSWWQRTGLLPQPTTTGHEKSHSVICKSSCIHLAFIRLVITGLWQVEAKNQLRLPWPLTLPTEYHPHFRLRTK